MSMRFRHFLFLSVLLVGVLFINNTQVAHAAITDTVSGATNGYSLRLVKASYNGALVKIRRTDGGEANVFPDTSGNFSLSSPVTVLSGSSTATTLSAFVSGTDAYVEAWYDQVGGNNLNQATQSAQPKIVSAGAILTNGITGKPALSFNGTNNTLTSASTFSITQPFTATMISAGNTQSPAARVFDIGSNTALYQVGSSGGMYAGSYLSGSVQSAPYVARQMTMVYNTTSSQFYTNGTLVTSGTTGSNNPSGTLSLGGVSSYYFNGEISEFILFTGNLNATPANRQAVETDELNAYVIQPSATALGVAGATNVYSLRKLVTSYSGPLVRIRRTDGGEADVYPDAGNGFSLSSPVTIISGGSQATVLNDFITGTNAYVETWYDQTGNVNVTQSTQANQPQIVSSGSVITNGATNRPAVSFNGTSDTLNSASSAVFLQPITVTSVSSVTNQTTGTSRMFSLGSSGANILYQAGSSGGMYAGSFLASTVQSLPYATEQASMVFNTTASQMYVDGTSIGSGTTGSNYASGGIYLGSSLGAGPYFNGTISEFIIYNTALGSTNRQSVENNQIMTFVTQQTATALGVTGSVGSYGLRQLVTSYSGPLVRIRRTDGGEADVYPDTSGNFSTTSSITVISGSSGATTLSAFIASTDAFVEIWYDQTGNQNVSQATQADQPKIVSAGTILTGSSSNRAGALFDGNQDMLESSSSLSLSQPVSIFMVSEGNTQSPTSGRPFSLGATPNNITYQDGSSGGMYGGTFLANTQQSVPYTVQTTTLLFNGSSSQMYVNGSLIGSGNAGSNSVNGPLVLGSNVANANSLLYFNGTIYEFILYNKLVSGTEQQTVQNSEGSFFINNTTEPMTITSPSRLVSSAPLEATTSYIDQKGLNVSIPFIQTSTTLNVSASVGSNLVPNGGGVKFVLTNNSSSQQVAIYDMSAPYTASFTNLSKGTYTLDTYVVDSNHVVQSGTTLHDQATNIGIGDIYVAIGDSITKGANGISDTQCVTSGGTITDWTQSLPGTVSNDDRNFCQWSSQEPKYFKSWMPELNNKLESYNGYPVFILNEGYGGYTAAGYITDPMGTTAWQNRVASLSPNKFLVMLGTNDTSSASVYSSNMNTIISTLESNYAANPSSIYVAKMPYAAPRPVVQPYLASIDSLISSDHLNYGPNLWTFFYNHQDQLSQVDNIHPTVAGYLNIARLWALSIISPTGVAAASTSNGIAINWSGLSSYDAIPNGTSVISGYRVKYGTSPGNYTSTFDAGNATSATITGITSGMTYYFAIDAYSLLPDNTAGSTYTAPAGYTGDNYSFQSPEISLVYSPTAAQSQGGYLSGGGRPVTVPVANPQAIVSGGVVAAITKVLKFGMIDSQVRLLQQYLNTHGFIVAKNGAGSVGHETTTFGRATKIAVMTLQKKAKLTPDGVVGSKTLAYIHLTASI